jgi:hypothetical protein
MKKMKKIFTVILLVLTVSFNGYAQISNCLPADIVSFKKNIVYVVIQGEAPVNVVSVKYTKMEGENEVSNVKKDTKVANGESEYNKVLRFAMSNFWRVNKVEYITEAEFEEKRLVNNNYFLTTVKYKTTDKVPVQLNLLALVKGGPKFKKIDKMPILAAIPLSYNNVPEGEYIYKLPAFVQFLQDHIDYAFQNAPIDEKKMINNFNSRSKEIKHGTLYVCGEDLTKKVSDLNAIQKYYKGEVMIVEPAEIEKAIRMQDSHVTFVHVVGPPKSSDGGLCRKYIFSAKGGELLYIGEHNVSKGGEQGLQEGDFKSINK